MRSPAHLALAAATLILLVGCAAPVDGDDEDDNTESSEAALVTLTPQQCHTPAIQTSQLRDSDHQPIYGTAHTTLNGCITRPASAPMVTGAAFVTKAKTLIGNTQSFAAINDTEGNPIFSRFSPRTAVGMSQDIDVTLAIDNSPYSRIRVTRQLLADGRYSLTITNVTAFTSNALGFWPITVIKPGNFKVNVIIKPESNGVRVTGYGDVTLEVAKDKAAATGQLVHDVFEWLRDELN